ncbi:hypothetical protein GGF32_001435 [Allomyces javanicus]|nr:hypothetical protein GGF32_001435 [Allomyces javanicus]
MTEFQKRLAEAGTNDQVAASSPDGSAEEVVDEKMVTHVAAQHEKNPAKELSLNDEIKALKKAIAERGRGQAKE